MAVDAFHTERRIVATGQAEGAGGGCDEAPGAGAWQGVPRRGGEDQGREAGPRRRLAFGSGIHSD